jgi:hypothetical protein
MPTASSLSLSTGGYVQQFRQQQAQRTADQAAQNAQSLQSQARIARQDAARAQQNARELEIQAGQARSEASRLSINVRAATNIETAQTNLQTSYDRLPDQIVAAKADTYTAPNSTATVSTANVGTVVNTTA